MKIIGFILAVYLILLSGVPCCGFDNCSGDKTEQSNDHQPKNDCGNCSPFFSCAGCTGFTFTIDPISFQPNTSFNSKIFTGYIESEVPDIPYDFWRPPKIA